MKYEPHEPSPDLTLAPEILLASRLFPFTPNPLCNPTTLQLLASYLPPYERASYLLESFFKSHSHYVATVPFDYKEELLTRFYPGRAPINTQLLREEDLHELALLFILMSNGFIGDVTKQVESPEPEMYMYLCRAALGLRSVFVYGTIASVQAIFEMVSFYTQHLHLSYHEAAWKVMDLGFIVALSVRFTLVFRDSR